MEHVRAWFTREQERLELDPPRFMGAAGLVGITIALSVIVLRSILALAIGAP